MSADLETSVPRIHVYQSGSLIFLNDGESDNKRGRIAVFGKPKEQNQENFLIDKASEVGNLVRDLGARALYVSAIDHPFSNALREHIAKLGLPIVFTILPSDAPYGKQYTRPTSSGISQK